MKNTHIIHTFCVRLACDGGTTGLGTGLGVGFGFGTELHSGVVLFNSFRSGFESWGCIRFLTGFVRCFWLRFGSRGRCWFKCQSGSRGFFRCGLSRVSFGVRLVVGICGHLLWQMSLTLADGSNDEWLLLVLLRQRGMSTKPLFSSLSLMS
jgi:hypothetical protein